MSRNKWTPTISSGGLLEGQCPGVATLFERHAKAIYNYCFRRVGGWSAAEDLLCPPKLFAFDPLGTLGKDAKLEYWVLEGRGKTAHAALVVR
jgi:hypothetical protein